MRSKEEANDYRYFPEPDLIPIKISKNQIADVRKSLPELPEIMKERFMNSYDLSDDNAELVTINKETAPFLKMCCLMKFLLRMS